MDGNSAKKAPVLDHLVGTTGTPNNNNPLNGNTGQTKPNTQANSKTHSQAKPVLTSMNGANSSSNPSISKTQPRKSSLHSANPDSANANPQVEDLPKNRRTDKSQFEIELARTVNKIMLEHFEHASEQIVQQVLSEVRARLPGRKKS
jgi:hypothetical protein